MLPAPSWRRVEYRLPASGTGHPARRASPLRAGRFSCLPCKVPGRASVQMRGHAKDTAGAGRTGLGVFGGPGVDPVRTWHPVLAVLSIAESCASSSRVRPQTARCAVGEHGPHDLPGAVRNVAPPVAERADEAQPAAGPGEGARAVAARAALLGSATARSSQGRSCGRPSRTGRRGRASPGPGGACRSALVSSSETTIAASGQRSAAPPSAQGGTVKSRATRTDPAPARG